MQNTLNKEKTCKKCFLSMPVTTEYFYKAWERKGKLYLRSICIECSKDESIKNYDENRGVKIDKAIEKRRKYKKYVSEIEIKLEQYKTMCVKLECALHEAIKTIEEMEKERKR